MKNRYVTALCRFAAVFVIATLLTGAIPADVLADSTVTVKIGYIDYEGFITADGSGGYSGYGVELLSRIAACTGWKYEFVFDTWENHLAALEKGEIDFLCHAQKTAEREKTYLFSRNSAGSETGVIYVRTDNGDCYYNDYSALDGKKIGLLGGSYQTDILVEYAAAHGFSYSPVYYDRDSEAFAALDAGIVDAVAMGSLAYKNGYKTVCRFAYEPFYFMSGKMNAELMTELDSALADILSDDPSYITDLFEKYYSDSDYLGSLSLTREEAEYIRDAGTIKVGMLPSRQPFSYYDAKTGELSGINKDIADWISGCTGLCFEYLPLELTETTESAVAGGRVDIVAGAMRSSDFENDPDIILTDTFSTTTVSVLKLRSRPYDAASPLTVVVNTAFKGMQSYISENYPSYTLIFRDSTESCLDALLGGEADIMLQNVYVMNYLLQKPKYADIEILPATFAAEEDCFMAGSGADPLLISVLNKAIGIMPSAVLGNIILSNTVSASYTLTTGDIIYKCRVPLAVILALLIICFILAALIIRSRQKHVKALEAKNGQLSFAVSQAERANTAKSSFLSRMSHEIRTPMNAIVGLAAIAKKHEDDPQKTDGYLCRIEESSKVLLGIINDVLDMSAIESEKLRIADEEFDLKKLLGNMSSIYYAQCRSKGIDFSMCADVTEERVTGDAMRVGQILMNLISNAYKFTDKGGKISVTASEIGKNEKNIFVRFTVADTGCGMSAEMLGRLFRPFEQETAQTAYKYGGSGLGLSITKNLAELMHGSISVKSEQGTGTEFTVDLPFGRITGASMADTAAFRGKCALIVDDDELSREYTAAVLGRIGISYDTASNGDDAVRLLRSKAEAGEKYDICFIDWRMPGMNGLDVTCRIREVFDRDTVVIIVSAFDLCEIEDDAKGAGADLFLSKPIFQSSVFDLISQITGNVPVEGIEKEPSEYDFSGHRALLAEDNEMNTEVATDILGLAGMEVDHAADGAQAVDMFTSSQPGKYDIILMDVQMPGMDGYEAAAAIRASSHPEAKTIPIYAMTANAFTEDIAHSMSAGMDGHLSKPIDTKLLYRTIYNCITKKKK